MSLEELFEEVFKKIPELAQEYLGGFVEEALSDSKKFCIEIEGRLEKWLGQYQRGELNREELEWLVKSLKSLAHGQLLSEAGIAQARTQNFFEGVLEFLIKIAITALL